MEESAFQSQFTKTSGSMPLTSAAESDNSVSGPRVAALAVIMCVCLMAMAGMVLAVIVTTSDILGGGSTVDGTDTDINSDPLANPRPSAAKHPIPATPKQISSIPTIVKEIICTVSWTASSESMYPPDKYCDYLFYIDVYVHHGRIDVFGSTIGWNVFRQRASTYKIMKLGISFELVNLSSSRAVTRQRKPSSPSAAMITVVTSYATSQRHSLKLPTLTRSTL
ncbi:uncharacterized protein [Dermacentor albipictus]|uniref:uncharacterized protein isoform X2 n=1 Tax=Dermacentor albipictus TaxID=60249 RepID=UPI0038FC8C45